MADNIVYWDANAFLGLINEEPDKLSDAKDVWEAMEKGLITTVTSALTIAEVIHAKSAGKVDPSKRAIVNAFFRRPNLVIEPLTRQMAELARDVVWDFGIKPKDACHFATAAFHGIEKLHTFDQPMIDKGVVTIRGTKVTAMRPKAPRQLDLLAEAPTEDALQKESNNAPNNKSAIGKTKAAKQRRSRDADNGSSAPKDAVKPAQSTTGKPLARTPLKAKTSKAKVRKTKAE
jgi:predicted nucleic acid-binding protein